MELCEKLKQVRKENNLTQQQLADELCLSRTVITKYEKGYSVPSLDTLILISNYFKTSIFDEYKDKFKLFFLSIKCIIPYLISLIILLCSSLTLINKTIKINYQYGYNIYNDEMKVKNCDEIQIIKYLFFSEEENTGCCSIYSTIYSENKSFTLFIENEVVVPKVDYYLIFLNNKQIICDEITFYKYKIINKPFIYPLKDYDESLPYNEQTGECSKILNYYIDLIEKVK